MVSYNRPRLITADDRRYRAYVEQFILQRKNQRAIRPPRQRDLFGGQAEEALRGWLAERLPLSERRILEYEERRGRRAGVKYRELDALVVEQRQVWVFEIKASRTAYALRKACEQLRETRAILRLLYPQVALTILLVDTGIPTAEQVAALMAGPEPPPRAPEILAQALNSLADLQALDDLAGQAALGDTIGLLRFRVEDIIALAGAENLALDWSDDKAEPPEPPPPADEPFYTTSDADDDDDNPLADALRKAGL